MMQQQEQPLTVESLKRILANHDERLSRLENDKKAYGYWRGLFYHCGGTGLHGSESESDNGGIS